MVRTSETLPASRRAFVAARIFSAVENCFAHWDALPDFDWPKVFQGYLDKAMATDDRFEFSFATMRLLATLRNGHTGFFDDELQRQRGAHVGLRLRRLPEGCLVTASAHVEIPAGSILTTINGRPMHDVIADVAPFIAASNSAILPRLLFARPFLLPERLHLSFADSREVMLTRGTARLTVETQPTGYWLVRSRVFVLRLPSFETPAYEEMALRLLSALPGEAALVIDVRGNDGGDTPQRLVAALMPRPYRFWIEETPTQVAVDRAHGAPPSRMRWPAVRHEPQPGAFTGRIAILQDGGTFSAGEDFVAPFKDNGRARIFGETSAGSSGQPFYQNLGDGLSFRVGAKRQWLADGTEFEGVGIRPDVEVLPTAEDIRLGRDPVLDRAAKELGG